MATRRRTKREFVVVHWVDAAGESGWAHEDEAKKLDPPLGSTFGVIVRRTKDKLVMVGTVGHGDDKSVGDRNVIPMGMVRRVDVIGEISIEEDSRRLPKIKITYKPTGT